MYQKFTNQGKNVYISIIFFFIVVEEIDHSKKNNILTGVDYQELWRCVTRRCGEICRVKCVII